MGGIDWSDQSIDSKISSKILSQELLDITNDFNLEQMVSHPTRRDRSLDLFFTDNATLVEKSIVVPGLRDHDGIALVTINLNPKRSNQKPRKVFLYNKADMEGLRSDMTNFGNEFINDPCNNIETLWTKFKTKLHESMDRYIPSKMIRKTNKSPWINGRVKRVLKRKQRAYNTARKSGKKELTQGD